MSCDEQKLRRRSQSVGLRVLRSRSDTVVVKRLPRANQLKNEWFCARLLLCSTRFLRLLAFRPCLAARRLLLLLLLRGCCSVAVLLAGGRPPLKRHREAVERGGIASARHAGLRVNSDEDE